MILKFIGDRDSSVHHNIMTSVNCRKSPGTDSKVFNQMPKHGILDCITKNCNSLHAFFGNACV